MEGKRDFEAEETVFPALSRDKLEFFGGKRFETLSFHAATGSQSALPRATNGHEATRAALPPPPEVKTPRPITVEAVSSSASLPAVSSFFFRRPRARNPNLSPPRTFETRSNLPFLKNEGKRNCKKNCKRNCKRN